MQRGLDDLEYVVDLLCDLVPVPLGLHEPDLVGKGFYFLEGEPDTGHLLAQQLDQPGRHLGGDGHGLEYLHGGHVDDHGTVAAHRAAQARLLGHVPGDPGRTAGDGDDVEPGLLGRLYGVDGALADGPVRAQQSAV